MGSLFATACLVPPDGPLRPEVKNHAPVVDHASISPSPSFFEADDRCGCFGVNFELFDQDNDALRVRVVSNPGVPTDRQRCLQDLPTGPAFAGWTTNFRLVPNADFTDFPAEDTHSFSVFVTDASSFAVPLPDRPQGDDCWRLPDGPDGGETDRTLIELRWVVRFVEGLGTCPGCAPPGGGT
ncbi:MAG: hypothetical protein IT384_08380 [Deltaproteobacteria bacterium]|nr:hypothetical protein [Deltaproteobacteria bacterium]